MSLRFFWRAISSERDVFGGEVHEIQQQGNGPTPFTLCGKNIGVVRLNEPYSMRDGKTENVTCPTCRAKGGPQ